MGTPVLKKNCVIPPRPGWIVTWTALGLLMTLQVWGYAREVTEAPAPIKGVVCDADGPVVGARVGPQGGKRRVQTDAAGRFILKEFPRGRSVAISAWKEGYYCALIRDVKAPAEDLRFTLIPYQTDDNPHYQWIPPTGEKGCAECHNPAIIEMSLSDAHLQAARNPRFLTMYNGTDMDGNQSPPTRYGVANASWKNLRVPLPPDLSKPYYGPGYVLDFPETPIDCNACHIPGASLVGTLNPNEAEGVDQFGVHCDFCHKVGGVRMDPVTHMPFPTRPGVLSMDMRRPFPDDSERFQLFFGTFDDDNVPEEDTRLPLLQESRYCASCHYGVFWTTVIYNSYGEWLESPYSDPASGKGKTCQDCHMPSPTLWKGKRITNVAPGKGGIERNPFDIHSHLTTVDETLLKEALTMTVSVRREAGDLVVKATLYNDKTGHHVPTDSPLRHLILLVDARDSKGARLRQVSGPRLPAWCGKGDPARGYYAGLPGKAYAKILKEKWTAAFPVTAYWRHTEVISDNRIGAFDKDSVSVSFLSPPSGKTVITATLLYRRAFKELMDQKKWGIPDIVMAQERLVLAVDPQPSFKVPAANDSH
ncbi:MAG: hypothetical protein JRL30_08570 [Deltaproteobacteria bacterium]|nr:hypothetical protein [Deltaproteobacteria bacterium]